MMLKAICIGEDKAAVGAADWRRSFQGTWSIRSITHTQMADHLAANPMGQPAHRAFTVKAKFMTFQ
jgi:hypothetical protein